MLERQSRAEKQHSAVTGGLVSRTLVGDREALARLYSLYRPELAYMVGARLFRNRPHEIDDWLQDCFVALYRWIHTYRGESSFAAWYYTVARNLAFKSYLYRRRESIEIDAMPVADASYLLPPVRPPDPTAALDLERIIRRMEPTHQLFITAMYIDGCTRNCDLARTMHMRFDTVAELRTTILDHARVALREMQC